MSSRRRRRPAEAPRPRVDLPERDALIAELDRRGTPLAEEELARVFSMASEDELDALSRRLRAMARDGQVVRNRRGEFGLVARMDLVRGRVIGHRDGFGFLVPDEGGDDLFLSPRQMRGLMHGDRAVARVAGIDRLGRREGALVEVLERAVHRVVGRYYREQGVGFVRPEHTRITHDVLVSPENAAGAAHGQIVVTEILEPPTRRSQPIGRIVEVLGEHMAPGMEIDVAIRAYELPEEWPEAALREASGFGDSVAPEAGEGRVDLRGLPLVTIDGEDARDFDDAVHCRRTAKGWKLTVAIADVAAYVRPAAPLDREARERGTSVYFPGRVIPMLPEALSNGLCSLNPDVDRLCLACELYVTRDGQVTRSRFFAGIMRSHARLTYTEVAAIVVDGEAEARARRAAQAPHLDELYRLYRALAAARATRGAMDFDSQEARFDFDVDRKIAAIEPAARNDAHRIIEECMVAANVAAAKLLARHRMPVLYRVHEGPSADAMVELRAFLDELGLRMGGGDTPEPRHFSALLESAHGRPDAVLIQTVLLRSMNRAVYSPFNKGHFGLAHEAYAHFTSPIRRYPDLLVHRAIKHVVQGGKPADFLYGKEAMVGFGDHTSMTERRADEATRDAVAWLKCEFMLERVGETYRGTVSGVTSFGLFVTLDDIFVEGLAHVSVLGHEYFHFDPVHHRLAGENSGVVHRLGDRLAVRVARVDLDERKVDFELATPPAPGKKPRENGAPRRGRGGRRRSRGR